MIGFISSLIVGTIIVAAIYFAFKKTKRDGICGGDCSGCSCSCNKK